MKLDRTINIGTVLHFVGLVVTLVVLYSSIITRLASLETRVEAMWAWFEKRIEALDGRRNHYP